MIHFPRYTSVYEQIFTCNCSIFSHNISQSEILSQATYRTWGKHIDLFCPTYSCLLFSSLFPLQWLSSTRCQPMSLTIVLPESIWEHSVRHSHPGALGLLELQSYSHARYWIHRLPPSCHHSHLDYPSHHSSHANFRCQKCFQVHYPHHFQLDNGWYFWFDEHLILEYILQGGHLQTKQVATVISLTSQMQLHHHVKSLTTMLWRSLQYLKCTQQLSFACFGLKIPSV